MSDRDRLAAVLLDADQAERGGGWTWDTASPAKRDQYRRLADRLLAAGVTMPASDGSADWDACDNCPKCGEIDD